MTSLKYFAIKILPLFNKATSNILIFIALKLIQSIAYSSHQTILKMQIMIPPLLFWSFLFQILNATFQWIPLLHSFDSISLSFTYFFFAGSGSASDEKWSSRTFLCLDWKFFNDVAQIKVLSIQELCRDADLPSRWILPRLVW